MIPQGSGDYDVCGRADYWQQYQNESFNMIGMVLGGIAAISLLVGGIGIMNIMLVTVTERTREIGIRRAIGAQRSSIVTQFLIEAGMLCGMGGIVGIIVRHDRQRGASDASIYQHNRSIRRAVGRPSQPSR